MMTSLPPHTHFTCMCTWARIHFSNPSRIGSRLGFHWWLVFVFSRLCTWCLFLCSIRLCLGFLYPCLVLCLVFPYSNDEFVLKLWQNSTYSFGTFKHIKQSVTSLPFFSWRYFWIFLSSCSNLDWRMYRTVTQLLTLTSLHHHFEKSLELSSVGLPVTWIWSLLSCYLPWLDGVHPLEAF